MMWNIFSYAYLPSVYLPGEMSVKVFGLLFSWVMEQCGDEGLWSQRDLELEPGFHAY